MDSFTLQKIDSIPEILLGISLNFRGRNGSSLEKDGLFGIGSDCLISTPRLLLKLSNFSQMKGENLPEEPWSN